MKAVTRPSRRERPSGDHAAGGDGLAPLRRDDFPILRQTVHGKPLVYLDSAATSQKPQAVLDVLTEYYETYNANVHRALHALGERATEAYEAARGKVARFLGADEGSVIFTKSTTEAINLVARAWGDANVGEGDEILLTPMEHHSNLVPWQLLAERKGATIVHVDLTPDGRIDEDDLAKKLGAKTKVFAFTHVSNVLGSIHPVADFVRRARAVGAVTVVDGAQAAPHLAVDLGELQPDFYAASGHKMLAPTGVGVLVGRREILDAMPPFLGGGEMIHEVGLTKSSYKEGPHKFEAGTPNIAQAIGMGAACDYLAEVGMDAVRAHEKALVGYLVERLSEVPEITVYGPKDERGGVAAFNFGHIHPHDVAQVLDEEGIAVRAGHHCAQPLMRWLKVGATTRASVYLYNGKEDVDALMRGIARVKEYFG